MLSPWLLLLTMARAIAGSRHPMDWPGTPEAPTCEQLRAFWETVSRMSRMAQVTNEIPVMAGQMQPALEHFLGNGHHVKSPRKNAKDAFLNHIDFADPWAAEPPSSPNSFLLPARPETPSSDQDASGMFGEFHEQSINQPPSNHFQAAEPGVHGFGPLSAVPLEAKKNGESEFYIPQWGSPEEVDTFGSFVDFDFGSPLYAMTRTPKNTAGQLSDVLHGIKNPRSSQVTCNARMNTDCTVDEQCLCKGLMKLACVQGKCLNKDQDSSADEKYGTWHDGPIPQSQLRLLSSPRKRNYRSIFM